MTRPLVAATAAGFDKPIIPMAILMYLDILNDPLIAWTGIGSLSFAANETGDPSLDGKTFLGTGTMAEVSRVSDGVGGSDAMEIAVPGVDLQEPLLRQLITNRNRWQFRRAILWAMLLDPDTDVIAGKPFRIKTGRMDQMPLTENDGKGLVKVKIEGQQSYGNQPLRTRYSEWRSRINSTDTSQNYAHSLANMTANLGQSTASPSNVSSSSGGGGSKDTSRNFLANVF